MTSFIDRLGVSTRTGEDIKVLLVGIVCTLLIFSVVTMYEGVGGSPLIHIDLVQVR